MRTLTLTVTLFALVSQGEVAFAQQNKQKEATIVTGMTAEIDLKGDSRYPNPAQPIWCAGASCNPNKWLKSSRKNPASKNCRSQGHRAEKQPKQP